ncbi:MAG: 50S ribosomal protein L18 [Chlamydiae bacterium]|nr:50S ribosomal protein L18 [Chlamydiota bacterium]
MENSVYKSYVRKQKRAKRVRKKLKGTSERPRLSVYKSNAHIFAQIIDDEKGHTLAAASTLANGKRNKESAAIVGDQIAEVALSKNIKTVIFDRGPFKYHGVIKALADKARERGLEF